MREAFHSVLLQYFSIACSSVPGFLPFASVHFNMHTYFFVFSNSVCILFKIKLSEILVLSFRCLLSILSRTRTRRLLTQVLMTMLWWINRRKRRRKQMKMLMLPLRNRKNQKRCVVAMFYTLITFVEVNYKILWLHDRYSFFLCVFTTQTCSFHHHLINN